MSLFWWVKFPINSVLKESGIEAESFESWYSWFLSFSPQWFMIPARIIFQIHDSQRLLITYWLDDFPSGNLLLFCIISLVFKILLQTRSVSSFVLSRYGGFLQLNINHQSCWRNKPECTNYIRGSGDDAALEKKFQNWTLGNAISCFPSRSNVINSYVYFVELFSESCYSWFPSRSTKIDDSRVFKAKIHDRFVNLLNVL